MEDKTILQKIADSITIDGKHLIEVGPGYGALTEYILKKNPESLELVEFDADMIAILENRQKADWNQHQIEIHHQDILRFCPNRKNYRVIANIPYYITSPILFHFLHPGWHQKIETPFESPEEMTILMQKEVGEKILISSTKKPHFSYLSLAMHLACESIENIIFAPKSAFRPSPKVDSLALKFSTKKNRDIINERNLLRFWNICFRHPRKTLVYNLSTEGYEKDFIRETLLKNNYPSTVRAEAIFLEDWDKIRHDIEKK